MPHPTGERQSGIIKTFVAQVPPLLFLILFLSFTPFVYSDNNPSTLRRSVLSNGMVVIIEEDHSAELVAFDLRVRGGLAAEGALLGSGISHFIEHILFKGTPTRDVGKIEEELRSYGGSINGFTSYDYTGYTIVVGKEYFTKALDLITDVAMNAGFDPEEIEKEREVILNEIRLNSDDPERYISRLLWSNAFLSHPYKDPVIGYESLFNRLTRDELIAYYRNSYVPNNIILAICGDIDVDKALDEVNLAFKDFKRKPHPLNIRQQEPPQMRERRIIEERAINLTYCLFGFKGVSVNNEDMYPLDVLAMVLGKGRSSRLYEIIQRQKKLVHSIETYNYTPQDPGLFIISSVLEEDELNPAIDSILAEIEKIKSKKITDAELNEAKNEVVSEYFFSLMTIQSRASQRATNELLTGDHNFSQTYVEGIRDIKTEDIQRVAHKYLTMKNLTISAIVPKKKISSTKEGLLRAPSANSVVKKHILNNGLIVLFKEDHRLPIISIRIAMRGGLRAEEKDKNGLSNLVANMLTRGTFSRTSSEIAREVEKMGAGLASFSGKDTFGISLDLLNKDLIKGMNLASDVVSNPKFQQEEFERAKQEISAQIKQQLSDIFDSGWRLLRLKLFSKHPYRFHPLGTEGSLKNITRDDCFAFYKRFCRADNMVVAISGDVSWDTALKEVESSLGKLKSASLPAPIGGREDKEEVKYSETVEYMDKEQSLLVLGFKGAPLLSDDRYALEVMGEVLSGGGGRLYGRIREDLGLAYTLGAYPVFGVDTGYIIFYAAAKDISIPTVKESLIAQIDSLKTTVLDEEELRRAKESLIGRYRTETLQDIGAFSMMSALDELYGLGFDNYTRYEAMVRNVTADSIQNMAKKYLDMNKSAVVIIMPKG